MEKEPHPIEVEPHPMEVESHPLEPYPMVPYPTSCGATSCGSGTESCGSGLNPVELEPHPVEVETHPVEVETHPVEPYPMVPYQTSVQALQMVENHKQTSKTAAIAIAVKKLMFKRSIYFRSCYGKRAIMKKY